MMARANHRLKPGTEQRGHWSQLALKKTGNGSRFFVLNRAVSGQSGKMQKDSKRLN